MTPFPSFVESPLSPSEYRDPRLLVARCLVGPVWLPKQLHGSATGYASKLPAGNWLHRRPYNPVLRATRAVAAVRGAQPYVIVADDVQKDEQERTYGWYLQLPIDVELKSHSGDDFILGEAAGSRRMLVRVLQADATTGELRGRVEDYTAHVDTRRGTRTPGRRMIVEVEGVAPEFKILLFPHVSGDRLPTTSWTRPGEELCVRWEGQHDELVFASTADAYRIAVTRSDRDARD